MNTLAPGISYVDVNFLGVPGIIATAVLHGPGGVALIDPGPTSTPALRGALEQAGIRLTDVRSIVLTHINLNHAGRQAPSFPSIPMFASTCTRRRAPRDRSSQAARQRRGCGVPTWIDYGASAATARVVVSLAAGIDTASRDLTIAYAGPRAPSQPLQRRQRRRLRRRYRGHLPRPRCVRAAAVPPDIDPDAWRARPARVEAGGGHYSSRISAHAPAHAHLTEMADRITLLANLVRVAGAGRR
jgi:hypothetical protein